MVGATDRCPMTNASASETNVPQYVFVGAFQGVNCWPDGEVHDIWAKFIVNVYLEGGQRFSIDGVSFDAGAGHGASRRPKVLMINVKQDAALIFAGGDGGGKRLRKVMTSAPSSWLETVMAKGAGLSPVLERFFSEHLSSFTFEPGLDLIELAEQISNPRQALTDELLNLYRKSRGLEIMRLAGATGHHAGGRVVRPRRRAQLWWTDQFHPAGRCVSASDRQDHIRPGELSQRHRGLQALHAAIGYGARYRR